MVEKSAFMLVALLAAGLFSSTPERSTSSPVNGVLDSWPLSSKTFVFSVQNSALLYTHLLHSVKKSRELKRGSEIALHRVAATL